MTGDLCFFNLSACHGIIIISGWYVSELEAECRVCVRRISWFIHRAKKHVRYTEGTRKIFMNEFMNSFLGCMSYCTMSVYYFYHH